MKKTVRILLAAGQGVRFDPAGTRNKLLQPLADGSPVAVVAASKLLAVTGAVYAVVQSADNEVAQALKQAGCLIVGCPEAAQGMGASLVCGIRAVPDADAYLVALADMPYVQSATLMALVDAIAGGADIAAPICAGQRGNPVAFSARHQPQLLQLSGDEGARKLLKKFPVTEVHVMDAGIFQDIDRPEDLQQHQGP